MQLSCSSVWNIHQCHLSSFVILKTWLHCNEFSHIFLNEIPSLSLYIVSFLSRRSEPILLLSSTQGLGRAWLAVSAFCHWKLSLVNMTWPTPWCHLKIFNFQQWWLVHRWPPVGFLFCFYPPFAFITFICWVLAFHSTLINLCKSSS